MPRGFGLLSVLISLLIIGLLTAVALKTYFSASVEPLLGSASTSVRPDQAARLAEAQAILGRAMMALSACAQGKAVAGGTGSCGMAEAAAGAGVGPTGLTADGRWKMTAGHVSVSGNPAMPTGQISLAGVAGTAAGLSVSLFATPGGTITRCDASGGPPPASPSSGQGC